MSLDFPASPSNGDVHNGFIYDSTLGVWDVATSSGKFAVTAGSGVYIFNGSGTSSDNNPTLYLTRGQTYEFEIDASGHPFYIKTSNSTGTSNAYSDGVTNNGTASGTITFTVQMDAPDTLHYNCSAHASMNAPIYILDRVHSIDDLSDVDTTTAAPTDGQALVWDNSASKWEPATISSGGASVSVSVSAPSSPSSGDLWFDPATLKTYVYYNDGNSNQWVQSNPTGGGGSGGGSGGVSTGKAIAMAMIFGG